MFDKLIEFISDLHKDKAVDEVKRLLAEGTNPFEIIEAGLMQGVDIVGQRFESGVYFLPDLLRAGNIVDTCSSILKPLIKGSEDAVQKGTVVIGTVAGDIHDLGKNIVISTLESGGFRVVDIGVDVPTDRFIEAVKKERAVILGMSALLTVTMVQMEKVISALRKEPDGEKVKVIVGGAPLDQEYAQKIGADAYCKDARQALIKVRELCSKPV